MITFKCKMCGGDLSFEPGADVTECPYCGTKQTLPKLDDERRANLYDRANHFRRLNEYDKAMNLYEQILAEDRTDAEAYWSIVLCRYGIEYVDDPATKKRVPTVNRAQLTSVLSDEDYLSALNYATGEQCAVYEAEAAAISEIQKGILAISNNEKPFDVFICYKETDENGRRTPDSVLANELYHLLTNEGFKVFFSRITLEDKIGSAYEPYIFAALRSARVMVVLGTRPEYFSAVWVKNEWSRYLALIKAGENKTLIPAYRDMDPYGLPDEFSHLQSLDMSRLGFMQDMLRGIKKICGKDAPKPQPTVIQQVTAKTGVNVSNLMKRALLFIEDGNLTEAGEYLEKVLDEDAEYAPAYVGKVLVTLKLRNEDELKTSMQPFEDMNDWKKALRFATPEQSKLYEGYMTAARDYREDKRCEKIYDRAMGALKAAKTETDYTKARDIFITIPNYRDAKERIVQCDASIEEMSSTKYESAVGFMNIEHYAEAAGAFKEISTYKDSAALAEKCEGLDREKKARAAAEEAEKKHR